MTKVSHRKHVAASGNWSLYI